MLAKDDLKLSCILAAAKDDLKISYILVLEVDLRLSNTLLYNALAT